MCPGTQRKTGITIDTDHGIGLLQGINLKKEYIEARNNILPLDNSGCSSDDFDLFKWWQVEKEKTVIWFTLESFFWFPRTLIGIGNHLCSFYDHPELLHRINSDLADWHIQIIESICRVCKPGFMTFAEDMSYNPGMMISEELFDEFMLPYYQKVIPYPEANGIIPFIDSDGDVT